MKVTFVPTEVKVGQNSSSVIDKADTQVSHTYEVLNKEIFQSSSFKAKFYLDFFMKLYFANAAKFYSNGLIAEDKYVLLQEYKSEISQGNLTVDNEITNPVRNKFVFSLKSEELHRLIRITDDYSWVEVPEADAFRFAGVKMNDLIQEIQANKLVFDTHRLLENMDQIDPEKENISVKTVNSSDSDSCHKIVNRSDITNDHFYDKGQDSTEEIQNSEEMPAKDSDFAPEIQDNEQDRQINESPENIEVEHIDHEFINRLSSLNDDFYEEGQNNAHEKQSSEKATKYTTENQENDRISSTRLNQRVQENETSDRNKVENLRGPQQKASTLSDSSENKTSESNNQGNEPDVSDQTIEKISEGRSMDTDSIKKKEDARILLGTIDGSNTKTYWEYSNSQLANRHMLITGKSGQGKTYFIQTLLLELSKLKKDSLVIDYTDSYLPGQLDPYLEKAVPEIHQHIVKMNKLAINPFKANDLNIGTFKMQEGPEDVVARVAEVLDFVFNLGVQQKSKLIMVMNEGMSKSSHYSFTALKKQLIDDENLTLYGRIQPLLDNDPFNYDNSDFSWSDYFGHRGQINIIQLSQFPASVKNAIIEFILWDLFNFSRSNADKHLIYPVFLDEVQNLDFNQESPVFKVLTEGRKFGWSGVFATQSLSTIKGEISSIYNAAEQIHFLPPESETRNIAKKLTSNSDLQKQMEQSLSVLQKGQCIVSGQSLNTQGKLNKTINIVNIDSMQSRLN